MRNMETKPNQQATVLWHNTGIVTQKVKWKEETGWRYETFFWESVHHSANATLWYKQEIGNSNCHYIFRLSAPNWPDSNYESNEKQ